MSVPAFWGSYRRGVLRLNLAVRERVQRQLPDEATAIKVACIACTAINLIALIATVSKSVVVAYGLQSQMKETAVAASPLSKISACPDGQITFRSPRVSCPQEGRIAIVTNVGRGMRWTEVALKTSAPPPDGEVVWS
jgi:hypothetical protein